MILDQTKNRQIQFYFLNIRMIFSFTLKEELKFCCSISLRRDEGKNTDIYCICLNDYLFSLVTH